MTNREYLETVLSKFGVQPAEIDLMLLEQNLYPDDVITDFNIPKKAVYYQLPMMMAGLQNITEGGYSITWNLAGIKAWYSLLASQLQLPDSLSPGPKVTGISPW